MTRRTNLLRPALALCGALSAGALLGTGCSSSKGSGNEDGNGSGGSGADGSGGGLIVGTGGQGGSGARDPNDCGGTTVDAEPVAANLLFVIDRSSSMGSNELGSGTRWVAMIGALQDTLDDVPEELSVGLQFFPGSDDPNQEQGCYVPSSPAELTVPVGPSKTTVPELQSLLMGANPAGNTPAASALQLAYQYFTDGPGKDLAGKSYVLLALDGGPNCNFSEAMNCEVDRCTFNIERPDFAGTACGTNEEDEANNCCTKAEDPEDPDTTYQCLDGDDTLAKVQQLAEAGITTLVVGIPGSDEPVYIELLDQLAVAGGAPAAASSPRYYRVDDAETLTSTLKALTTQLVTSCELLLETAPPDRNKVNIYIDDEVLPQAGDDGWEYDDSTTPPTIVIKGVTCAALESTGAQSVRVEFNCPTIVVR